MKMFRLITGMIALLIFGLAGCGTQSPDFTPVLQTLTISPSPAPTVAYGDTLQFSASGTCTTPPDSSGKQGAAPCTPNVTWSVKPTSPAPATVGNGTISNSGLFTSTAQGQVDVVATADGITASETVTVGKPTLKTLVVTPATKTIGQAATQSYLVEGTYSDTAGQPIPIRAGDTIQWASYVPGTTTPSTIATVSPTTGTTTTATSGNAPGTATITACSPDCAPTTANKIIGTATLTVNNQRLVGLDNNQMLTPATATIAAGASQDFQMMGIYSDGTTQTSQPIPNSQIQWQVTPATVATAANGSPDPTSNKFTVSGVAKGLATVTGTLDATTSAGLTDPTKNSSTGTLTVLDSYCTVPYSQPAATTTTALDPLCLGGLLCSIDNPNNVIDSDPGTFAALNSAVGLLGSSVTLTINSGATAQPGGTTAGFVIARPAGLLLSAEVLSQFTVSTLLGTTVQDTFTTSASTTLPPLLRLTLLGTVGGVDQVLVSFDTSAAKPYDGMSIKFSPGVASALETTNVYSACASIDKSKLPQ